MHEFDADSAGIHMAGFLSELAFDPQFGMLHGLQESKWIEVSFQISPMAEGVEHPLALTVGGFH